MCWPFTFLALVVVFVSLLVLVVLLLPLLVFYLFCVVGVVALVFRFLEL